MTTTLQARWNFLTFLSTLCSSPSHPSCGRPHHKHACMSKREVSNKQFSLTRIFPTLPDLWSYSPTFSESCWSAWPFQIFHTSNQLFKMSKSITSTIKNLLCVSDIHLQPKGSDALWLGSKGTYGSCVGSRKNCRIPLLHSGHIWVLQR